MFSTHRLLNMRSINFVKNNSGVEYKPAICNSLDEFDHVCFTNYVHNSNCQVK